VLSSISAYIYGLTTYITPNESHKQPVQPKPHISIVELKESVDEVKTPALLQNARVPFRPEVSDWNQSEPVVIFINQFGYY
jgi:hypothetical protein